MADIKQKLMDYSELDPSGCRLWNKSRTLCGYGLVKYQGRLQTAHRVAYQVFIGPIPKGLCVLHSCHSPSCINHEHLRVGTKQDNSDDMVRAGRQAKGERSPRAKLTAENVRYIREKYSSGEYMQKELSAMFGVSRPLISHIVTERLWKESASL